LTSALLTRLNIRLFHTPGRRHETHVSTLGRQAQADARFSRPHEIHRRPQGALGAPRQGPRAPDPLTAARLPRGLRPYRLAGAGAFEALFDGGRRRNGNYLQLIAAPAQRTPGRVGFVIPKKVLPLAVDRNRVRRILREAVRASRGSVVEFDLILRLQRVCSRADAGAVAADAAALLAALGAEPRA
jgi:ribonuclease P protein component